LLIQPETQEDYDKISNILALAFGRSGSNEIPLEVSLVQNLRETKSYLPSLALVAIHDGKTVGHILYTRAKIVPLKQNKQVRVKSKTESGISKLRKVKRSFRSVACVALAPLAVTPAYQHQGIGSALIQESLRRVKEEGHKIVVLLGHPEYYSKFGFVSAVDHFGIKCSERFQASPGAFQCLELVENACARIKKRGGGMVMYSKPFNVF